MHGFLISETEARDARNDMMKNQIVTIAGKEVEVRKLTLRKIANLFSVVEGIPDEFLNQTGESVSNAEFLRKLPTLIVEILPKYANLASETLDNQVTGEDIENADFDEVFDLVEAFLRVNDIPKIMERVGKVTALATGSAKKREAIG